MVLNKDDQKFLNQKLKYIRSDIEINLIGIENNKPGNYKSLAFQKTIYDDNEEKISIPKRILKKFKNFDLVYNYDDIHMYVFSKNIYMILEDEKIKNLTLIKSDLIPYLINHLDNKNIKALLTTDEFTQSLKIKGYISETNKNYS
jgi:hypothetical protein